MDDLETTNKLVVGTLNKDDVTHLYFFFFLNAHFNRFISLKEWILKRKNMGQRGME